MEEKGHSKKFHSGSSKIPLQRGRFDGVGGNQHRYMYVAPNLRNDTFTAQNYKDEILEFHVIHYAAEINDSFLSCNIIPDRIQFILWRTGLKLKLYSL